MIDVATVIARLGGPAQAARRLKLKATAISMWKTNGQVPPCHVPAVSRALGVHPGEIWPALAEVIAEQRAA